MVYLSQDPAYPTVLSPGLFIGQRPLVMPDHATLIIDRLQSHRKPPQLVQVANHRIDTTPQRATTVLNMV